MKTVDLCDSDALQAYSLAQVISPLVDTGSFGVGTWVLFGANVGLVLLAAFAVYLRCSFTKSFHLFSVVDGVLQPNAPLIASLSLAAFGLLTVTFLMLFNRFLRGDGTIGVLLSMFALLPSTMFGWAWWHTVGVMIHFRRTADESKNQRWFVWSRWVFNSVQVAVPVVVGLANTIALPLLMGISTSRTTQLSRDALILMNQNAADAEVDEGWLLAQSSCRRANALYRALWGSWCGVFLLTLFLYSLYAILLGHALCRKLHSFQPSPAPLSTGGSWEQKVSLGGSRGVGRQGSGLGLTQRTATFTDAMIQRKKTAEALSDLRTTLQLSKWELAGFAAFCLSWTGLALYRIVQGLGLITNLLAWGRLWRISVAIATFCAAVILVCIIVRTRVLSSATARSSSHPSQCTTASCNHRHQNHHGHTRNPSAAKSIHVMVETFSEVICEHDHEHGHEHNASCGHPSHGEHLPHLHEPAKSIVCSPPTPIRVRFPTLGEEDEEDDEKMTMAKPGYARTESLAESAWSAPTGWDSPPPMAAIGSPLVVPRSAPAAEEIALNFMPLNRVVSDLDLDLAERSPSIEEKK